MARNRQRYEEDYALFGQERIFDLERMVRTFPSVPVKIILVDV